MLNELYSPEQIRDGMLAWSLWLESPNSPPDNWLSEGKLNRLLDFLAGEHEWVAHYGSSLEDPLAQRIAIYYTKYSHPIFTLPNSCDAGTYDWERGAPRDDSDISKLIALLNKIAPSGPMMNEDE